MAAHIKYPIVDGMKQCGDCNQWKPVSDYKKSRNHLTSRCVSCLKIYAANYRKRPEVKEASAIYHHEYMKNEERRKLKNEYQRLRNKKDSVKEIRNIQRRAWAAREKQKAINYKGGCCQVCGYNKCLAALDFHHVNPLEKEGYGGGALKAHWTFEKNKAEIDKCVLVCVRCHREIHSGVTKCPSVS